MMADLEIKMLPVNEETLAIYCRVPAWFEVRSKLEVEVLSDGLGGMAFKEKKVARPYTKYYGETEEPLKWLKDFDTRNWVIFFVQEGETHVGGLTVAVKTPELRILGGRSDLACVWDIRLHPEYRHHGIGSRLFNRAVE